jgi:hypothetical protein
MSKENRGNQPERELETEAKQALRTVYTILIAMGEYFEAEFT